jgi:hypothetical protein
VRTATSHTVTADITGHTVTADITGDGANIQSEPTVSVGDPPTASHASVRQGEARNRGVIEIVPGFRPLSWLLLRDRNRVEFRWINGIQSTRYRNELTIEADVVLDKYHFIPFAGVEAFYNGSSHSWDEEWYTAGVEWPFKRVVMVETYYRQEECPTRKPSRWNVGSSNSYTFISGR